MFPEKVVGSVNLQTGQSIPPDFAKTAIMQEATEEERGERTKPKCTKKKNLRLPLFFISVFLPIYLKAVSVQQTRLLQEPESCFSFFFCLQQQQFISFCLLSHKNWLLLTACCSLLLLLRDRQTRRSLSNCRGRRDARPLGAALNSKPAEYMLCYCSCCFVAV